ncbi:MAG: dockerin type I repeat-containing protein [Gemmatimonadota bacterium]|nr:MAG: dockerin type I repeat-containing protein [Gemmatimonadota bacterium]
MDSQKEMRRYVGIDLILLLMLLVAAPVGQAQTANNNFQIRSSSLNSGGGQMASANFGIQYSMGQPIPTGISQGENFAMFAGFQPTYLEEFVLPTAERGDVNGDGGINVLDVLAVVNDILGTVPLTGDAPIRADCNGDEEINVLDALGIVNVILGIASCVP